MERREEAVGRFFFVSVSPTACSRRGQPVVTHDRVTEAEGMPSVRSTRCLCSGRWDRTRTPLKESSNSKPPKPPSSLSTSISLSFLHARQVPQLNTTAWSFYLGIEEWAYLIEQMNGKGGRKRGFRVKKVSLCCQAKDQFRGSRT